MQTNKLLLDTHVFLWWRANNKKLKKPARNAICEADIVFVSAASAWEAYIKTALGRLRLPDSMKTGVIDSGFVPLSIGFSHAQQAAELPNHHHDPFDRMLIGQAQVEQLTIITHDSLFKNYDVPIFWT